MTSKEIHDLMRAIASSQALAERMVLTGNGGKWHAALSVLKNEVEEPKKTLVRSIGRMIANVFHGDWRDEGDPENTLVEDLPIKNGVLRDVVVSWARDAGKLKKEVDTIRACLDHAGVLDNTIFKDFTVDSDVSTPIAGVKVQYDNQNRQAKVDGNLHLGKIMAAAQMLHIPIPASWKADLDLHFQMHIPHDDPRSKFIAAMLAVQLQSKAVDLTCQRIESHRKNIASTPDDALLLHGIMEEFVHPAKGYLLNAIAATRKELDRACSVHPSGKLTLVEVDAAARSVMERNYEGAFALVESVENASPGRFAMKRIENPVVALDLDGVLLDFESAWRQCAEDALGRVIESIHLGRRFGMTAQRMPGSSGKRSSGRIAGEASARCSGRTIWCWPWRTWAALSGRSRRPSPIRCATARSPWAG